MLHTLEDFCAWCRPDSCGAQVRRRYFWLRRLMGERCRKSCYRALPLPKRDGGTRLVMAPSEPLKQVQRAILLLLAEGTVSPCAAAYRTGCGVLSNAAPHVGKPLIVRLDIRNFFGSIRFAQVFSAIDGALRLSPLVGRHYLNAYDRTEDNPRIYNRVLSFYFARFCTLDGALVQGAPTSPQLSNLVFRPLDERIASYCETREISYTRYSDDLTFSGAFNPHALISFVRRTLEENGFLLNTGKTAVLGRGVRQKITGVVVNQSPHTERAYRRKIRQEVYYLERFGLAEHLRRLSEQAGGPIPAERYLMGLLGRIGFVLQICPADGMFPVYREKVSAMLRTVRTGTEVDCCP